MGLPVILASGPGGSRSGAASRAMALHKNLCIIAGKELLMNRTRIGFLLLVTLFASMFAAPVSAKTGGAGGPWFHLPDPTHQDCFK